MFKSLLRVCRLVMYERSNLAVCVYFIILCSLCCGLSLHFLVCDLGWDNLNTYSLKPHFSHVSMEKITPGQSLFSPCHCH